MVSRSFGLVAPSALSLSVVAASLLALSGSSIPAHVITAFGSRAPTPFGALRPSGGHHRTGRHHAGIRWSAEPSCGHPARCNEKHCALPRVEPECVADIWRPHMNLRPSDVDGIVDQINETRESEFWRDPDRPSTKFVPARRKQDPKIVKAKGRSRTAAWIVRRPWGCCAGYGIAWWIRMIGRARPQSHRGWPSCLRRRKRSPQFFSRSVLTIAGMGAAIVIRLKHVDRSLAGPLRPRAGLSFRILNPGSDA
jgi:hypothetical protein